MARRTEEMICASCGEATTADPCLHCDESPLLDRHYLLLQVLGTGSEGTTYRARQVGDRGILAIKEMPLRRARDDKARELLRREAEILRQLDHPAIPTYLEDFTAGKGKHRAFYLVQEFIGGRNLAAEERDHRYGVDEVLAVLDEILKILVYLHQLSPPVIHRDIKPSNVMRRTDGGLVLIDFGSVRDTLLDLEMGGSTVTGTFGYMAPEQMMGDASAASDLYGLGALAVRLLSRREPHTLLRHDRTLDWEPYVRAPRAVRRLLRSMLRPDPRKRAHDAEEVRAEIRRLRDIGQNVPDAVGTCQARPVTDLVAFARAARHSMEGPVARVRATVTVLSIMVIALWLTGVLTLLALRERPSGDPADQNVPVEVVEETREAEPPTPQVATTAETGEAEPPTPDAVTTQVPATATRVDVGTGTYPPRSGETDAAVSIVVFSDFGCTYCARFAGTTARVDREYGDRVAVHFRDFPLDTHRDSLGAHEAARCAHAQGRFWAMHDQLFAHWRELSPDSLGSYAREAGLDEAAFQRCLEAGDVRADIESDRQAGWDRGVKSTPTYFVNGGRYNGARSFEGMQDLVEGELRLAESAPGEVGAAD